MRWVFHVGYPKCASTAIQMALQRADDIFYCGKNRGTYAGTDGTYIARHVLAQSTRLTVEADLVRTWKSEVERLARADGKEAIVVSDELFTSVNKAPSPLETCDLLNYIFGDDLQIVFVVRNHWDLLRSNYKQQLKVGMPFDYSHFCFAAVYGKHSGLLRNLNYGRLFSWLKANSIEHKAFLFEKLIVDGAYYAKIMASLGVESGIGGMVRRNISPGDPELESLRRQNAAAMAPCLKYLGNRESLSVLYQIDWNDAAAMVRQLEVSSPTLDDWLKCTKDYIAERKNRDTGRCDAKATIDWRLPEKLHNLLDREFQACCEGLDAHTGEKCSAYGYLA